MAGQGIADGQQENRDGHEASGEWPADQMLEHGTIHPADPRRYSHEISRTISQNISKGHRPLATRVFGKTPARQKNSLDGL
jgi:hypothetical protein